MKKIIYALLTILTTLTYSCKSFVESKPMTFELEFTRDEIQCKMDENFPREKIITSPNSNKQVVSLCLENPNVFFSKKSTRIGTKLDLVCKLPSMTGSDKKFLPAIKGNIKFDGKIEYDSGLFYYKDAKITEFNIPGVPNAFSQRLFGTVNIFLGKILNNIPVYDLKKKKNFTKGLSKMILKNVTIKENKVVAILGLPEIIDNTQKKRK